MFVLSVFKFYTYDGIKYNLDNLGMVCVKWSTECKVYNYVNRSIDFKVVKHEGKENKLTLFKNEMFLPCTLKPHEVCLGAPNTRAVTL